MKGKLFFVIIMLLTVNLYAVPGFIVHQGYMEDSSGNPVNGVVTIVIAIYGSPDGDDILFEQALDVAVNDGFYSAEINHEAIMPLFDVDKNLFLEISVSGNKGKPRQKIGSVPYAFYAAKAYDVIGDIHPNSIYINGNKVIDETGKYLGQINAVTSITAGDGLKGGTITDTGIISLADEYKDGSAYDSRFINTDEKNSITSDMIKDETIHAEDISDGSIMFGHINPNGCSDGQIMRYSKINGWECSDDIDTDTTYSAGTGLSLNGNAFSVNFGGNGSANTVARSDHNHDSAYSSIYHNHDSAYVNVKGDTMVGKLAINIDAASDTPIALTTSNGSVVFEGPDGVTPVKGAGIRLMWVPSKKALRVGEAVLDEWDNTSIGNYSYAFGNDVTASGDLNFVFGESNNSSATRAFIAGIKNLASGDLISILGNGNRTSGSDNYIIGFQNRSDGNHNYVVGNENYMDSSVSETYAMGNRISFASASNSVGIGSFISISSSNSVTIGKGDDSSMIGGPLVNDTSGSLMVGFNSTQPTLFVGPSSGGSTTGNVGIGNKNPVAKLDIDGGVRTRPYSLKYDSLNSNATTTYTPDNPNFSCDATNRGEIRVLTVTPPLGTEFDALCACMKKGNKYFWNCFN